MDFKRIYEMANGPKCCFCGTSEDVKTIKEWKSIKRIIDLSLPENEYSCESCFEEECEPEYK